MKKSTILRTIFVCSFLLLAMLVYEVSSNYGLSEKVVKTNATPITNKVIVLDAGHRLSLTKEQLGLLEQRSRP